MGIRVLPPDINSGDLHFSARGHDIQFGLAAIRNVGESAIGAILACRAETGQFSGLDEFCEKVDLRTVNRRVLEALIKAGTFDSMGRSRRSLMEGLDRAIEQGQRAQRDRISGQKGLFQAIPPTSSTTSVDPGSSEEWPDAVLWAHEKETLGYYLTGHPLQQYSDELERFSQFHAHELTEEVLGKEITIGGVITESNSSTLARETRWLPLCSRISPEP